MARFVPSPEIVVLADDRTGALETAGMCADLIGPVTVLVGSPGPVGVGMHVVDIQTRHDSAEDAGVVVTSLAAAWASRLFVLKMDSTLRGNWAAEAVALALATGRPGMVVASFPALGRTCVGGKVLVDVTPVHLGAAGNDVRRGVESSRPREHLLLAGARSVAEVSTVAELRGWLGSPTTQFVVCDARRTSDLVEIGQAWAASTGVCFVGTAASISTAVAALATATMAAAATAGGAAAGAGSANAGGAAAGAGSANAGGAAAVGAGGWAGLLPTQMLVVCGSLHPMARAQVEHLRQLGAVVYSPAAASSAITSDLNRGLAVVCSARADGPVTGMDADQMAASLAACVQRVWDDRRHAGASGSASIADARPSLEPRIGRSRPSIGVLIIGGDTSAAVLGDLPLVVGGTWAPGLPWATRRDEPEPLIMTRAGGFGSASSLAELLSARLPT